MAQDEHTPRCSNSSSGGGGGGGGGGGDGGGGGSSHRSSKKSKHKKVPQRGMGVAQLEKIISEEQQKKDVAVLAPNSIISPSNSCSNLATIQKVPNFRPPPISPSSIPLPPPLPPNHHPLISKTDGINPISASSSFSRPTNTISGGGGGSNWCRLWSDGDYNFEGEKHNHNQNHNQNQNQNHGLDHSRYSAAFPANLGGLPYESNPPIWPPPPNLMLQRSQHFQQPCSSSMVNVSAGTSSSASSSVLNFQMEPPSNQSYNGNNYQPLWPEEDKMIGMKRPYPFSLENVPIPSFHCKFPSAYVSSISRSDETASCSNGGTIIIEPAHPVFRENPSSSGPISDTITRKFIDENQSLTLTRDFLKLAPPQASCIGEQPHSEPLPPHKGHSKDPTHLSGRTGSNPQPFLTFFPAAKTPMEQPGNSNGEAGESVDLNLKL